MGTGSAPSVRITTLHAATIAIAARLQRPEATAEVGINARTTEEETDAVAATTDAVAADSEAEEAEMTDEVETEADAIVDTEAEIHAVAAATTDAEEADSEAEIHAVAAAATDAEEADSEAEIHAVAAATDAVETVVATEVGAIVDTEAEIHAVAAATDARQADSEAEAEMTDAVENALLVTALLVTAEEMADSEAEAEMTDEVETEVDAIVETEEEIDALAATTDAAQVDEAATVTVKTEVGAITGVVAKVVKTLKKVNSDESLDKEVEAQTAVEAVAMTAKKVLLAEDVDRRMILRESR